MKKLMFMIWVVFTLVMFFTACENEAVITPENDISATESLTPDLIIHDYLLLSEPEVSEADLNSEFTLLNDGTGEEEIPVDFNEESGQMECKRPFKDSLFFYFTQLDLSKEQGAKIHYALSEFHKCKMHNHRMLRKINMEILMKANKERMVILEKLKKNEITKEQAEKALKHLHQKIHHIMKNDPVRQKILTNLHACHKELIENIRLILTKEQWEKLLFLLKKGKV
jgi:hypothetical protein